MRGMRSALPLRAVALLSLTGVLALTVVRVAPASPASGDPPEPARPDMPLVEQPERFDPLDLSSAEPAPVDFDALDHVASKTGSVRVIVGLRTVATPEGVLTGDEVVAQHARIAQKRKELLASLAGASFRVVRTYKEAPYVALELSRGALRALRLSHRVATVQEDTLDYPALDQTTARVEATESAALGRTGAGKVVAILDTGVDKTHSFLQQASGGSKVVSEACYSTLGDCPGGATSSTAAGSGVLCTYAPGDCKHGTHVAGIAAGRGTAFSGVAPGANLISIQVYSSYLCDFQPCARTFASADPARVLQRLRRRLHESRRHGRRER